MGAAKLTGAQFALLFVVAVAAVFLGAYFGSYFIKPRPRCGPFAPGTAFNPYPPTPPRKGYTRKGGQNPPQSQVRERPNPPAPLRSGR